MAGKKNVTAAAGAIAAAAPVAAAALNPAVLFKLNEAEAAGGIGYVSQADGEPLVTAGLIEVNGAIVNPNNSAEFGARLTDAGKAWLSENGGDETDSDDGEADAFEIESDIPLAAKRRGNGGAGVKRASQYPFDKLEVGQSFHVKVSDKMPKPNRTMGAAASVATKRYAVPVLGEDGKPVIESYEHKVKAEDGTETVETRQREKTQNTRVFTVRAVDETDPKGPGARIWRES